MVSHGVAHHVGDLVEAAVVDLDHGVQNASLDRLESVLDVWDCPVLDYIGGVLDEVLAENVFCVCHALYPPHTRFSMMKSRLSGVLFPM